MSITVKDAGRGDVYFAALKLGSGEVLRPVRLSHMAGWC